MGAGGSRACHHARNRGLPGKPCTAKPSRIPTAFGSRASRPPPQHSASGSIADVADGRPAPQCPNLPGRSPARAVGGMRPPTEAASVQAMNPQRKLFWAWCGFTFLWWLGWLASDGGFIALNFQFGGWRDAFLHLTLFLVVGIGVPLVLLLIGWIALRLRRKGATSKFKKGH
jgi:hypothetical protein